MISPCCWEQQSRKTEMPWPGHLFPRNDLNPGHTLVSEGTTLPYTTQVIDLLYKRLFAEFNKK